MYVLNVGEVYEMLISLRFCLTTSEMENLVSLSLAAHLHANPDWALEDGN